MSKDSLKVRVLLKEWGELRAGVRLHILAFFVEIITGVIITSLFMILTLMTGQFILLVVAPAVLLFLIATMGLSVASIFSLGIRIVEIEEQMEGVIGKGFLKWETTVGLFPHIGEDIMFTQIQKQINRVAWAFVFIGGGVIAIMTWFGIMWLLSVSILYGLLVTVSYIAGYGVVLYYVLSIASKRWARVTL